MDVTSANPRAAPQRYAAFVLGLLLIAASLSSVWAEARYPHVPGEPSSASWLSPRTLDEMVAAGEALLGLMLVAALWPRHAWSVSACLFTIFAVVTAAEALMGKSSCGCFGAVQIRPVYTMCLDLAAIALLLLTGRPATSGPGPPTARKWLAAGGVGVSWVLAVAVFWQTRPAIATAAGQDFGKAGELVVLEPEKWGGQRFDLPEHIDAGSQLASGKWIVLLVHHDCDHCAAAVPRYVEELRSSEGGTRNEYARTRLAVIEMPPFGDAADPPPWQLPASVFTGRLDQTRDWFATTPIALLVKDGLVIASKDGDEAESPDPGWFQ